MILLKPQCESESEHYLNYFMFFLWFTLHTHYAQRNNTVEKPTQTPIVRILYKWQYLTTFWHCKFECERTRCTKTVVNHASNCNHGEQRTITRYERRSFLLSALSAMLHHLQIFWLYIFACVFFRVYISSVFFLYFKYNCFFYSSLRILFCL